MSSPPFVVVADIASIESLAGAAGAIVGSVATAAVQKYYPNTDKLLETCRQELEEIKARLKEIPHERRERIRVAASLNQCKSLESLEEDLIAFSDDRWDLNERSSNSYIWQRRLPMTRLRDDINTLKDSIRRLRTDTNNTTNSLFQSQPPPRQPTTGAQASASESSPPVPRTLTTGGSPSTQGHTLAGPKPSRQDEYPLETITRPAPVHIRDAPEPIPLPLGLV